MKNSLLVICFLLASLTASAEVTYSRYDVNGDHSVDVADVTTLVNIILGSQVSDRGDINGDKTRDVVDVTELVDYILGKREHNGHTFVDLGLESGTLWATENLGASKPEERGDFYAWGETSPKTIFSWGNYKWNDGMKANPTKYTAEDGITILELADDAANVQWGGLWRLPSREQIRELKDKCSWSRDNARGGYVVTGPNGNTIFLPVSGRLASSGAVDTNIACYWTCSLSPSSPSNAYYLSTADNFSQPSTMRYCGLLVRPVSQ